MKKSRTMRSGGEEWVNINDIRAAINDEDMMLRVVAMFQVCEEDGEDPLEVLRMGIAYFFTESTGALSHHEN